VKDDKARTSKKKAKNLRVKKTQYVAQTRVSSARAASIDIFQGFPKISFQSHST